MSTFSINKLVTVTIFIFIFSCSESFSQFNFVYNDSIQVIKNNDTISLAWSGGLNHPQFSTIDLNFDGIEELVAFEPDNNFVHVYKRSIKNGKVIYKYWYGAEKLFPSTINTKLKLVDYDGDGRKDLFTYFPGGLTVYRNISNSNTGIQWQLVANPIMTFDTYSNAYTNLFNAAQEFPAIYDIDGDGDMDIMTFSMHVKRIVWNKNLSMETYGNADSLKFVIQEECWGGFTESASGNGILLHSTIPPCGATPKPSQEEIDNPTRHQGGGSILALDINNDNLTDLLIGDHEYNNISLVVNGGTSPDSADMVSFDNQFPDYDTPINLANFVSVFYEDIDLDGVKDLIAATSETTQKTSENTNSAWFYKNIGSNTLPHFELKTQSFLQELMIDNGTGSIPIFVDANHDGLTDLLVANDFNYVNDGQLSTPNSSKMDLYTNVGSNITPIFKLSTPNWNNFANSGYTSRVSPAFGDLDGDGDLDMITGIKNGKLFYYENSGNAGTMNFSIAQIPLLDDLGNLISVSGSATPELFDLDDDGKLDLIIGQENGPLLYYKNVGTGANYSFHLTNNNLGGIYPSTLMTIVPRFIRDNNVTYLWVGDKTGKISFYDGIDSHLSQGDNFNLVSNNYAGIDTKGFSAPAIGQIRNNGKFDLLVGNVAGGIWSYQQGDTSNLSSSYIDEITNKELKVYPNPTKGNITLEWSEPINDSYQVSVADVFGRVIYQVHSSQTSLNIQLDSIKKGVYFIKVTTINRDDKWLKKIVIE